MTPVEATSNFVRLGHLEAFGRRNRHLQASSSVEEENCKQLEYSTTLFISALLIDVGLAEYVTL